jgi:hypothetical protein
MDQRPIDRIYECSFAPELWPDVLDGLSQIAGARGGTLFVASTKVLSWTSSEVLREGMAVFANSDILTRGQRVPAWLPPSIPAF